MRSSPGNRFLTLSRVFHLVVFLMLSRITHITTTRLIQVDNPGDLTLGGLFPLTSFDEKENCRDIISVDGMRPFLAMYFAVETINSDDSILPNITLGTKLLDTCKSRLSSLDYTLKHFVFGENNGKLSEFPIVGLVGPATSIEAGTISKVKVVGRVYYSCLNFHRIHDLLYTICNTQSQTVCACQCTA